MLFAGLIQEQRVERLAIFGAKLEDMPDLDGALDLERLAAFGARLAFLHQAKVGPMRDLNIAINCDVAEMEPILISASSHRGSFP